METIEIYKRPEETVADKENAEKYLNSLGQDIESLKNWQECYKGIGLQGQAELFERKARYLSKKKLLIEKGIPYPKITNEQMEVLSGTFNCCVSAEEFSAQSMPPDVVNAYLEAKEYKEVGIFDSIKVMYYDGDPILIAETDREPKGDGKYYLLARWGDGLKPWEWFMSSYLKQKRANIPSLRSHLGAVIASSILMTSYLLLPAPESFDAVRPFLLSLGVGFFAISAWSLVARSKAKKSYSRLLNNPIPSPFAIPAR